MLPQKPAVLPRISLLPFTDSSFVRAIEDVALLAGGLIESVDASMLTIAVPSDRWGGEMPLVAWNQRLTGCPALARTLVEEPLFGPALDALCMATDELFTCLDTWGWDDAEAPELCLITDGVGVVLSTRRPTCDADGDWLLELGQADSGAITIRAPDAGGAWSLVMAQEGTLH